MSVLIVWQTVENSRLTIPLPSFEEYKLLSEVDEILDLAIQSDAQACHVVVDFEKRNWQRSGLHNPLGHGTANLQAGTASNSSHSDSMEPLVLLGHCVYRVGAFSARTSKLADTDLVQSQGVLEQIDQVTISPPQLVLSISVCYLGRMAYN